MLALAAAGLLAFGVFGQVLGARVGTYIGRENLILIWLNALELSQTQMKAVLELVEELLPLREQILGMQEKLHDDLLKFTGSTRELRELLSSYQTELRSKLQALEEKFVSGLKKILTVSQWERLQGGFIKEEKGLRTWPGPNRRATPPSAARIELLRGLTLIRLLPDLQEALAAKLAVLEK